MSEVGFRLGRRSGPTLDGHDPSFPHTDDGVYAARTAVGILLFDALGRYDARRAALLREANAIGTMYLRAELLDVPSASVVRGDLRAYVAQRLAFARAEAARQQRAVADAKSSELQRDMWRTTMQSARRNARSTMVPLVVAALNDTINLSTEERAVLTTHPRCGHRLVAADRV